MGLEVARGIVHGSRDGSGLAHAIDRVDGACMGDEPAIRISLAHKLGLAPAGQVNDFGTRTLLPRLAPGDTSPALGQWSDFVRTGDMAAHDAPTPASRAHKSSAMASASLSSTGAKPRSRTAAMTAALSALPLPVTWRLMVPTGTPW